jgi:hypothetical protein
MICLMALLEATWVQNLRILVLGARPVAPERLRAGLRRRASLTELISVRRDTVLHECILLALLAMEHLHWALSEHSHRHTPERACWRQPSQHRAEELHDSI